jgi:hypothetical protein
VRPDPTRLTSRRRRSYARRCRSSSGRARHMHRLNATSQPPSAIICTMFTTGGRNSWGGRRMCPRAGVG